VPRGLQVGGDCGCSSLSSVLSNDYSLSSVLSIDSSLSSVLRIDYSGAAQYVRGPPQLVRGVDTRAHTSRGPAPPLGTLSVLIAGLLWVLWVF
jgi:hypothetical protein